MRGSIAFGVFAIAACGDGIALPDAAPVDAGPERGLVTVHVRGGSANFGTVYFQNADSTIALATRTNELGDASALMASGGFVTVFGQGGRLYTWANVQVGDELTLDLSFEELDDVFPSASVRIDAFEGATDHYLFSRCESFVEVSPAISEPFTPFFQPCSSTTSLLLLAWAGGRPLGYRYAPGVNLLIASPIDLRGGYLPIDTTVDVIAPADHTIRVQQSLTNIQYVAESFVQSTGGHVVVPVGMPVIPGTTVTVAQTSGSTLPKEDGVAVSERVAIAWGPASATTSVDLTTPNIRELTRPELDLESYSVRWTESEDGIGGDVVWVSMGLDFLTWTVIAPRTDETVLRLPVLPQRELQLRPESLLFFNDFALISAEGGYDRLRPYLLGHWIPSAGATWPRKEASGRVNYRSLR